MVTRERVTVVAPVVAWERVTVVAPVVAWAERRAAVSLGYRAEICCRRGLRRT
jgi:hypothetical protein